MSANILPHRSWYGAPWSRSLKVVSVLTTVILVGTAVAIWIAAEPDEHLVRWTSTTAFLLLLGFTALFAVRGYRVQGRVLVIQRTGWRSRISLQGLQEAHADPKAMTGSRRLFGNGGLFAFTGWYRNRQLGRYRAFATDPSRAVVLSFKDRRVVVTPDEPEAFVRALSQGSRRLCT